MHQRGVMHIRNRTDALENGYLERLRACDALMFSGGNQLADQHIWRHSFPGDCDEAVPFRSGFVVAGTSAGAMAMSNTMIYEGNATRAHLKGEGEDHHRPWVYAGCHIRFTF